MQPTRRYIAAAILLAPLFGSWMACTAAPSTPERQADTATPEADKHTTQSPESVSEQYFQRLGNARFEEAYAMWSPDSPTQQSGLKRFKQSMLAYQTFDGEATGPARKEGAAGTLYAEVPIQVSGSRRGEPFSHNGTMSLKRCNNVPGCSQQQRQWKIRSITLEL